METVETLERRFAPLRLVEVFSRVTVMSGAKLEELAGQAGYGVTSYELRAHQPEPRRRGGYRCALAVLVTNELTEPEVILGVLAEAGWMPADIYELLGVLKHRPKVRFLEPLVVMGTTLPGNAYPYAHAKSTPQISLTWGPGPMCKGCHILAYVPIL